MPLRFYTDEHIPDAITDGLRARGIDVLRVQDDGHGHTDDSIILDRAAFLGRIVFTRDRDFLAVARHRQRTGVGFAGVVYAHQLRVSIGRCVTDLEIIALAATMEYMANRVEYLPL
jgi:predicted nuclease of predicted toxin-antitoxin system